MQRDCAPTSHTITMQFMYILDESSAGNFIVAISFHVRYDLCVILRDVMIHIQLMKSTIWNNAFVTNSARMISCGASALLHIIHDNIIISRFLICTHMSMRRPETCTIAPYMRIGVTIMPNNLTSTRLLEVLLVVLLL